MHSCMSCGAALPSNTQFCGNCGQMRNHTIANSLGKYGTIGPDTQALSFMYITRYMIVTKA
jgi:predicted amidophosphoribosyltransferase